LLTKYYSDDYLNKSEMGGTCGTHGGEQGLEVRCGEETWRKEVTWKTLAWRWENNVKKRFYEMDWESVGWIDQARDRDKGRAVVNTVVTLWFP
jgi:hypothetical protein